MFNCTLCNKYFSSKANYSVHKREKHTFKNTIDKTCTCCLKIFKSVHVKNKPYLKCEECRYLQKLFKTNDLIHDTYTYGENQKRYYINSGIALEVCSVYNCFDFNCHKHIEITECKHLKCNNCFVNNGYNYCEKCRENNNKSKNKLRNHVKNFKIELGGECVECGFNELFYLEFDHKLPELKIKQITRSTPTHWVNEKDNLQMLCGRCHRIKNSQTQASTNINKENKKAFVREIKLALDKCQICDWKHNIDLSDVEFCSTLDFDHIIGDKIKQISNLYLQSQLNIINEIRKTRLLCRHCHQLYTCLQRGGKVLQFYYTEDEIKAFKDKLFDESKMISDNLELQTVLDDLIKK